MSKKDQFLSSIRKLTVPELEKEIAVIEDKLKALRFALGFGKLNNLVDIHNHQKQLAQLKTVLRAHRLVQSKNQ